MDRTRRNNDSLSRSDQRESSVLVLDESTDAVFPRRSWGVLVEILYGGRKTSRRSGGEQKSLDGSLDEELGSSFGGISEESDDSSLLLAASATETAESTVVFVSSSILGNSSDWVTQLLRSVDEDRIRLVVLEMLVGDTHALTDVLDRFGVLLREEVGKTVILRPLFTKEVLRSE